MNAVKCEHVIHRFGTTTVLDGATLSIDSGTVVGLLGRSGVGKTTLLRILAGLEPCASGSVVWERNGARVNAPPRIGMVFQNLALWPHLTARQHIECVLEALPRDERTRRTEQALADVQLPVAAWTLRPSALSGGEGQRLALARAIAIEPEVLLLDEPLAHLDLALRGELLALLRRLLHRRNLTAVYVTHSWVEAFELCGRIALLDAGRIVQDGSPSDVFWRPASAAVARLTGPVVELPESWLTEGRVQSALPAGAPWPLREACGGTLLVRPQHLKTVSPSGGNRWTVAKVWPHDSGYRTVLTNEACELTAPLAAPLNAGDTVGLRLMDG